MRKVGRDGAGWLTATLLFLCGVAMMFRFAWLPGPAHSIGDNGDGTIEIATLEHWYRVFGGRAAAVLSPGWFWPAKGALGLTDTYFLVALPYAVARVAGAGPFGAYTAAVAVMAGLGFWGFVLLVRRAGVMLPVGGALGFVFAFGALPTFKLGHGQTYTIMLAPCLGLLLLAAWGARGRGARDRGGLLWAAAAGLLYGLLTLTAAQTAWFLGFEAGIAAVIGVLRAGPVRIWHDAGGRVVRVGSAAGVGLVIGLVPVAMVYRHALGHRREWSEVHSYLPHLGDILHVPPGNLLWYDFLRDIGLAGREPVAEVGLGFTPVLAVAGLAALVLFGRVRVLAGPHPWDDAARAFLAVGFLGWLLAARYGGVSPWYLIYELVPGASSIRTPFRIQLASLFFLCLGLAHVATRALVAASAARWAGLAASVGAALALICVEQLGPVPPSRETWPMARWLIAAHRPSFPCTAFYVLPPKPGPEAWFEYQSDAMLLSQWIGMPTINGNSSWYPDGWTLLFPDRPDYASRALAWIDRNALRDRVCGVDPRSGHWEPGVQALLPQG